MERDHRGEGTQESVARPAQHDLREKEVVRQPSRGLRVKAVVQPPAALSGAMSADSEDLDGHLGHSSDEEWVGTGSDASCSAMSSGRRSKQVRSGESSPPRSAAADSSDESDCVLADPPRRFEFESWGDLEDFLKQYGRDTYQSYRVRTNNKVVDRNKKIRESGSRAPLVPEEWGHYARTFICTHGGKYNPRGKGKRKRQHSRALQCAAQINACVQVVDRCGPKFALKITSLRLEHNHPLTKHTYNQYPQTRTAFEPEVISTVACFRDVLRRGATRTSGQEDITVPALPLPFCVYVVGGQTEHDR